MSSNPKISVIIPVYCCESTIARCLDSVLKQSFKDVEIIVINDCTPDEAMTTVKKYVARYPNVSYIELTKNCGPMIARQEGIKAATGDYYIFLDSDDTLPEGSLNLLYDEITSSKADIVISGYLLIWSEPLRKEEIYPKSIGTFTPKETYYKLLDETLTHNLAFCIFRSTLFNHNYFTIQGQKYGEDLILFYQLVANSKSIKSIHKITYNYFQDGVSSTRSKTDYSRLLQFAKVHNFKYEFLSKRGINEKALLRNIIPKVVEWYSIKGFRNAMEQLCNNIKNNTAFPYILKYITISQLFKAIIRRMAGVTK